MGTLTRFAGGKIDQAKGGLYRVTRRLYDAKNNLELFTDTYVQTPCENWVERIGTGLEAVPSIPKKLKMEEVLVIVEDCVEDSEEAGVKAGAATSSRRGNFRTRAQAPA